MDIFHRCSNINIIHTNTCVNHDCICCSGNRFGKYRL